MTTFHKTAVFLLFMLTITVPMAYTRPQPDGREKRQANVDVKKSTSEEADPSDEKFIFKKDDDDESSYDDPTIHDMDKRSSGGHRRKLGQDSNAESEMRATEAGTPTVSTTETTQGNEDGSENEVDTDADNAEASDDYDGSTSEQTIEDQSDPEIPISRDALKRDGAQSDEAENYETDFEITNDGSKSKRDSETDEDEKREKRFIDGHMNDVRMLRRQRHVNLTDAVVIRVKRVSRAGSSHKKNKLNERRGNVNRGEETVNTNQNPYTDSEINPPATH